MSYREAVDVSKFVVGANEHTGPQSVMTGVAAGGVPTDVRGPTCLAYTADDRRFVLVGTHGRRASHFFDPSEDDVTDVTELSKLSGQNKFVYRAVSQDAYNLYVKFLQTSNHSYLRQAEREQ